MRKIKKVFADSYLLGKLPEGCKYCVKGAKLVLFVTGKCPLNCWYCTISKARWQKDIVLANERRVKKIKDVLEEARLQKALGAGVTGGEPFVVYRRTKNYIEMLKQNFGEKFHIHLYTSGHKVSFAKLKGLWKAGLDEIRFHITAANAWETLKKALKLDWDVGIEIPSIPGQEKTLKDVIARAEELGVKFVNLNELEISERSEATMKKLGFKLKKDAPTAIQGSEETALKAMKFAQRETKRIAVHYCSAATKNVYQLQKRWVRRAKSIRKPWQLVDSTGFLVYGVIQHPHPEEFVETLAKEFKVPKKLLEIEGKEVKTSLEVADFVASNFPELDVFVVKQLPIVNGWEVERWPLKLVKE